MRCVARFMIAFLLLAQATLMPTNSSALPVSAGLRGEICRCACAENEGACGCCAVESDDNERSCRCGSVPPAAPESPVAPPRPVEERAPQKILVDVSPFARSAVSSASVADESAAFRRSECAIRPSRQLFLALRCQWLK